MPSHGNSHLVLCRIPLLADTTKEISSDYGVLMPKLGIALRGLFIINPEGVLEHVRTNPSIQKKPTQNMPPCVLFVVDLFLP